MLSALVELGYRLTTLCLLTAVGVVNSSTQEEGRAQSGGRYSLGKRQHRLTTRSALYGEDGEDRMVNPGCVT